MKRKIRFTYLVSLVLCAATHAWAQGNSPIAPMSPVSAKLTIPDTKLLPGVPFDMWIDLDNNSDATVGVGLCADMLVRPSGRSPFVITRGGEGRPQYPTLLWKTRVRGESVSYLLLKPHAGRRVTLPIDVGLEGPNYFDDDRVSAPGTYGIALSLGYCWGGFVTPQKSLLPPEYLGPVTTNEVTIERISPTGSDLKVWQRMQEVAGGHWIPTRWTNWPGGKPGDDIRLFYEIVRSNPDSNYVPYALLTYDGAPSPAYVNLLVNAINRFPGSPVIELLHWTAADAAQGALLQMRHDEIAKRGTYDRATARKLEDIRVKELAKARAATRPTNRVLILGREEGTEEPCPPDAICEP